ncbi:hypothetical protein AM493_08210 [Flavobacterium akiainvivens]|uniref:Membrane receptor RagA n=1 Tax=Flavobacterium akiainvivens TaxID=1202724 RepID=A0A0N0RQM5_9FLAO|nr:DUF5686 and carboxypeptidase regulatory-like domain-containing protein [Flavobacterium akiainvivens]KOS06022.1 hypothetical protein AM493_08210 [Flavobacterium akiainvivens]SFQ54301.1 CarboxypepD_reg-like domain-containing protein [Flavobacterium akiainvivens]
MHKLFTLLLCLASLAGFSQVKGTVKDAQGEPISFASVVIKNTYTGTTANDEGTYELPIKQPGSYTLVFQSIGYKTKEVALNLKEFPHTLNVTLEDESYKMDELVISAKSEDPAYKIMREAIARRKENSAKGGKFEADFYSKAIFRVKNVPKSILGQKIDFEEMGIDSTGSGVIHLSETVSHLTYEEPRNLKEHIIANKVSGDNQGLSFNTARGTFYNFYDDYIDFGEVQMVSPLAKGSFGYYKFKLEGSFEEEHGYLVNKIKVIAKRNNEPVVEGYIYILDDTYGIYAVDFDIKGYRIRIPVIKNLKLQQNFSYNQGNGIWSKNSQTFDIDAGLFGVGFTGLVTHVYTNYKFVDTFDTGVFTDEVGSFEKDSNKKDSIYWEAIRPVPLSHEEITDYVKKDSLSAKYDNPAYRDSMSRGRNKFGILSPLMGYDYYKNKDKVYTSFKYDGILQVPMYNTVQGWNAETKLAYTRNDARDSLRNKYFSASATFNYGLAEDRLRVQGTLSKNFGKIGYVYLKGGNSIEQFNNSPAIDPFINSVSTLFFKDNYMKLYDKQFWGLTYSRSPFSFLSLSYGIEYQRRRPLYNNADWVLIKNDHDYTSNNPLDPFNYGSAPFEKHHIWKAGIAGSIVFKQRGKYITYPGGYKSYIEQVNYPKISFGYIQGFGSSNSNYNYSHLYGSGSWSESFDNKGTFSINVKGGKFFNGDNIAFMDYKHFNGNETHVNNGGTYNNVFNNLPYYRLSTNNAYFELHTEHNDNGYIMNKIPLLSALQWNLVGGYHHISSPDYKSYHEVTVGFDNIGVGMFRIFRVDYVRSYQGSTFIGDGFVFGIKLLGGF